MSEKTYSLEEIVAAIMESPEGLSLAEINKMAGKKTGGGTYNLTIVNSISANGYAIFKEDARYYIFKPEPKQSIKYTPPVRERLPGEPLIRHILRNGIGGNDIELLKGGFYGI